MALTQVKNNSPQTDGSWKWRGYPQRN